MIIFPAIDIRNGKVVRLQKGDFSRETIFSDNPGDMARMFIDAGARFLHIIDLDGAKGDGQDNRDIIGAIAQDSSIPIQTGGGIRDVARIEDMLSRGVNRVILGTIAVQNPEFLQEVCERYPQRIVVSIDVKDGFVTTHGWQETTVLRGIDFAKRIQDWGVAALVFTDIAKDGMLQGINLDAILEIQNESTLPIIASGGVTTIDDLHVLQRNSLYGAIVGRAYYSSSITLDELKPFFA